MRIANGMDFINDEAVIGKWENIGWKEYLFMEWKMGNYIYGGMEPEHYVFKREK